MSKLKIDEALRKFENVKRSLPQVLANDAVRFFNRSFIKQGWEDTKLEAWQPRLRNPKKRDKTRKILVDSGALRRAVSTSLTKATFEEIKFEVSLPYAMVHNTGSNIMPQRKFMGDSEALRKIQRKKIKQAMQSIWQP